MLDLARRIGLPSHCSPISPGKIPLAKLDLARKEVLLPCDNGQQGDPAEVTDVVVDFTDDEA